MYIVSVTIENDIIGGVLIIYIKDIILKTKTFNEEYLQELPIIQSLAENKITLSKNVTFFVGENGTGKSTLLEAIALAYGFNPEGGTLNFSFHNNNTHSELYKKIILSKGIKRAKDGFFLRAESFYNVATYIDEVGATHNYGGKSLHNQSHGESFLSLIQNRFSGNGLYILDEPEAALSPMKLLTLMIEINNLVKSNSQFIIASHSPILMAFPNAEIFEFSLQGIKSVTYEETEHVQVTKDFLACPSRMLRYLLEN